MEEVGQGLVSLLQAAWIFSTLPVAVACFSLPGLGWFRTALLGIAKRGKILQSKSKLTVPQRFFCHFYVVGVLWTTILLVSVWSYAMSEHAYNVWLSVFLLLLMELQVLRRLYESIYVFNYSPSARMHIFGYLVGIFFYALAPLSLCCNFAPQVFDFVNGKARMSRPGFDHIWMFVTPFTRLPWYAWIGAAIFLWGWVHQLRCHRILGSLRSKTEKMEEYVIPYGDWFEYVSSPHYTAEIVLYGGLVVASGGADLSLWLLFAFVVANLVFAAMETQIWYHHKFEDYPRNSFYTAALFSLCCTFAPEVFNFVKKLVAEYIVKGKYRMSTPKFNILMFVTHFLRLQWYSWVGATIFLWGWLHQLHSSNSQKTEKLEDFVILYGDWFEYVSSSYYSAEIVIYGGLVVASGGVDLYLLLLFAFAVCFLYFPLILNLTIY